MRLRFLSLATLGVTLLASTIAAAAARKPLHDLSADCPAAAGALVEHFIGADCFDCWKAAEPAPGQPRTPGAEPTGARDWSLDWIVPAADDAPMAPGALPEAGDRLARVGPYLAARLQTAPAAIDTRTELQGPAKGRKFYVHSSLPHNGYLGVQLHAQGLWPAGSTAWVGLVEQMPVGTRDTVVPRRLVRVLVGPVKLPDAAGPKGATAPLWGLRWPMNAHPEALVATAWVEDAEGRITQITTDRCADPR